MMGVIVGVVCVCSSFVNPDGFVVFLVEVAFQSMSLYSVFAGI